MGLEVELETGGIDEFEEIEFVSFVADAGVDEGGDGFGGGVNEDGGEFEDLDGGFEDGLDGFVERGAEEDEGDGFGGDGVDTFLVVFAFGCPDGVGIEV